MSIGLVNKKCSPWVPGGGKIVDVGDTNGVAVNAGVELGWGGASVPGTGVNVEVVAGGRTSSVGAGGEGEQACIPIPIPMLNTIQMNLCQNFISAEALPCLLIILLAVLLRRLCVL